MPGKVLRSQVGPILDLFDVCYAGLQDLEIHQYGVSCNKIFEYMHAGKPILASYSAGFDPVASSESGITVAPSELAAHVAALDELLADDELRGQMGAKGRRYFDANHDFSALASSLVREFEHMLGAGKG